MNFFVYRVFYKALRLFLCTFSFLWSDKIQNLICERKTLKFIWRKQPDNKPIWFHCASGEIEYIKPLLRKIKEEQPDRSLFLTYFSPSGLPMAERSVFETHEADGFAPLPWDEPHFLKIFITSLNPQALIISRTDLWPELLKQCKIKNIPTVLVAATFAPGSKKLSFFGKIFLNLSLPLLDKICVVSTEDKKMAQELFPKLHFKVTGDPRFDQVIYRINKQKKELPSNLTHWAKEQIWIAGSTWPEDEAVIIPCLQSSPTTQLIIVPHETDTQHLNLLANQLRKLSIKFELYSNIGSDHPIDEKTQVLIFDQKGYLLDLYSIASLAFIGGSFKQQVHSVMEALGQGCFVIIGPHYQNNREAIEFQKISVNSKNLVSCIQNTQQIANFIQRYFQEAQNKNFKNLVKEQFLLKTKSTDLTFNEIRDLL